ncbi:MAG: hypothetical protein H7837_13310 [Magnetococcus sp. MYC-9]
MRRLVFFDSLRPAVVALLLCARLPFLRCTVLMLDGASQPAEADRANTQPTTALSQ